MSRLKNEKLYGPESVHDTYSVPLSRANVSSEIILPPEEVFKPVTKDDSDCAFLKLGEHIIKELGVKPQDISVSDVFVSENTYRMLSKYSYYWLVRKKAPYLKDTTEHYRQNQFAWLSLQYAPVMTDADFVEDGKAYVRTRK